ncbi:MAG: radical SAM protein, partial [Promethearchaeota archaeon]
MNFEVISVHFTRECNLKCPFCYRGEYKISKEKPREFFISLIKYIKKLTPQIALGGGEPLIDTEFIKKIGLECKKESVLINIKTNGKEF